MRFSVVHHLILATAIFTVILIAGILTISHIAVINGIEETEREAAPVTAEKILAVISLEADNLVQNAYDWGVWDDTYEFMADSNRKYIESNLQVASLTGISVNYILFFNPEGDFVYGVGADYQNESSKEVSKELVLYVQQQGIIGPGSGERSGIVPLSTGPILVATHRILRSDEHGPSRGTILIGRELDESRITYLSRYTLYPFRIEKAETDLSESGGGETAAVPTALLNSSSSIIITKSVITDISGKPSYIAHMEIPYPSPYNPKVVGFMIILASGLSVLYFAVILLYYRFYLARHITGLSMMLDDAASGGNLADSVPENTLPEITQLSAAAQRITTSLIENRHELHRSLDEIEQAEERWQILFEEANDAMSVGSDDGIINANLAWIRLFGIGREEIVSMPLTRLELPMLADGTDPMVRFIHNYYNIPEDGSTRFDWRVKHGGQELTFDVTIKNIMFRGGVLRYVVARDISLQALMEQERALALERIDENLMQLATLNDEIRNPLTVIAGLVEIDEPEHADGIIRQIYKIDSLIDRLDNGYLESEKVRDYLKKHFDREKR